MKRRSRTRGGKGRRPVANAARGTSDQSLTERGRRFLDARVSSVVAISRLDALGVAAMIVLVAVAYFPATQAGFVWDDLIFTESRSIHEWSDIRDIWFTPRHVSNEGHYWPLVYTTFWMEYRIWGLDPTGYHVVNVLLHLVNSLLVWFILRRLGVPGAWLAGAVFAVHPMHVESVAWVIERKDVLSALFYLTAVLAWLRWEETEDRRVYGLSIALFAAGLLCKSVVVTLPAALLVLRWWKRGRVTRADLLHTAPFFAVGLCVTLADYAYYRTIESVDFGYSIVERALIAARAVWFYATKLSWPDDLAVIYPLWNVSVSDPLAWAYVVAAAATAGLLWFFRNRIGRGPLAGALFFAITLSPTLGFIDYGFMQYSLVADRFQYLAGIGFIAAVVGAAVQLAHRLPERYWAVGWGIAACVVGVLVVLTWQQASVYRNSETLFTHVLAYNPKSVTAHVHLSATLLDQGRWEEGLATARAGIEHDADEAKLHYNAGFALHNLGEPEQAEERYRRALELDAKYTKALINLGVLLAIQERYDEALERFDAVIALDPDFAKAHFNRGLTLFRLDRMEEAERSLERALSLDPTHRDARRTLDAVRRGME